MRRAAHEKDGGPPQRVLPCVSLASSQSNVGLSAGSVAQLNFFGRRRPHLDARSMSMRTSRDPAGLRFYGPAGSWSFDLHCIKKSLLLLLYQTGSCWSHGGGGPVGCEVR